MERINKLNKIKYFHDNANISFDYLTKTLTRESITGYIYNLIENKTPFAICLIDVDNFKKINDTYGHLKGDEILFKVANAIVKNVDSSGVVGRWGGDEFIVVLNSVDYDDIWQVLHNINIHMQGNPIDEDLKLNITLTSGVSRFPLNSTKYEELFETADKALYRGKMKGRNCFIIYLEEKHKNIILKDRKDQVYSSTYLYNKVYDLFGSGRSLKTVAQILFDYGINHFMFDHIAIDDGKEIIIQRVHELSRNKQLYHIDSALLDNRFNDYGLFYCSDVDAYKRELQIHKAFSDQQIKSLLYCKIKAFNKTYGMIRIDTTATGRVWQSDEINLILTVARLIGLTLHYNNMELKDIK